MNEIDRDGTLKGKACDACGAPATNAAASIREVDPVDGFRRYEITELHYGCDRHQAHGTIERSYR